MSDARAHVEAQRARSSRPQAIAVRLEGESAFEPLWRLQQRLAELRHDLELPDILLLLEHAPVVTVGRHGRECNVLQAGNVPVVRIDRGGDVTYHGPGQLVAYWISDLRARDLTVRAFVRELEGALILALARFGIAGLRRPGLTGVWVRVGGAPTSRVRAAPTGASASASGDRDAPAAAEAPEWAKIAALGVRISRWISLHGVALNVRRDALRGFDAIVPCGIPGARVTAMEAFSGADGSASSGGAGLLEEAATAVADAFAERFGARMRLLRHAAVTNDTEAEDLLCRLRREARHVGRKPGWLRTALPGGDRFRDVRRVLELGGLATVCEDARCPNCHECWNAGTATFLILGRRCTRNCRFCAIEHAGRPPAPSATEPEEVARAAVRLGLRHIVVTSVTRDDLPDGGAGRFAATIAAVRRELPDAGVEVLIPDFGGDAQALARVIAQRPDVLNHNVETVPRLYPRVRPGADYRRSLGILEISAKAGLVAKSGFMLGLGESEREVRALLDDLRAAGCQCLTLGQYLQPGAGNLPVQRYYAPEEFDEFAREARARGFTRVQSGPLVRSSYRAALL
ncbi:MAG: lipoyl synthase [Candidatus Eisenbacteria bacterium]